MGKNNKARRAAKAKQRAKRGTPRSRAEGQRPGYDTGPVFSESERIALNWWLLGRSVHGSGSDVPELARRLCEVSASSADAAGERALLEQLELLWRHGWQPAELRRQARRSGSAASTRVLELAIRADHEQRAGQRMHESWIDQVAALGQGEVSLRGSWLATWRDREGVGRFDSYLEAAVALASIAFLPPLDVLIPPPGADPTCTYAGPSSAGSDDPVLRRIRKLLSKAESTEFESEASALTAKAQHLMTRHAIDQAMIAAHGPPDGPRMIRLPIDAPYADAKSLLLAIVAEASRSRAVFLEQLAMSTVVGHEEDLRGVEILYTSLLVQASRALTEAAHTAPAGTRVRSQSYRSSFYVAFAHRIGERLDIANAEEFTRAEANSARFLPVLRAREDAVEEFVNERYGDNLEATRVRQGHNYEGWDHGRRAADDAPLHAGELLF